MKSSLESHYSKRVQNSFKVLRWLLRRQLCEAHRELESLFNAFNDTLVLMADGDLTALQPWWLYERFGCRFIHYCTIRRYHHIRSEESAFAIC